MRENLRGLRENLKHKIWTLEVIGITIGNDQVHKNELEVKTKNGYKVIAPIGKFFTYVTKTPANLTTYSKKPRNYNGTIIFEIDAMKNSSLLSLKFIYFLPLAKSK